MLRSFVSAATLALVACTLSVACGGSSADDDASEDSAAERSDDAGAASEPPAQGSGETPATPGKNAGTPAGDPGGDDDAPAAEVDAGVVAEEDAGVEPGPPLGCEDDCAANLLGKCDGDEFFCQDLCWDGDELEACLSARATCEKADFHACEDEGDNGWGGGK